MPLATPAILWIGGVGVLMLTLSALCVERTSRLFTRRARLPGALRMTPAERAMGLLRDVLDETEYQQLTKRGYLDLQSPRCAQRIYRVPATTGLVRMYEGGVAVRELCIQPIDPLPSADVVAMHKLMIRADEQEYLKRARQYPPLRPNVRYRP